jgi:hypothetical protein
MSKSLLISECFIELIAICNKVIYLQNCNKIQFQWVLEINEANSRVSTIRIVDGAGNLQQQILQILHTSFLSS